jgi:hypothetical protein
MKRKMNTYITLGGALRTAILALVLLAALPALAGSGITNYEMGAKALDDLGSWAGSMMQGVIEICFAIATLVSLYGATSIYIKLQMGEDGFTKAVTMLIGGVLFMLFSSSIFPAIFGFNYGVTENTWSLFGLISF